LSARDHITVRLLAPEEAPALTALVRRCYGETYVDPTLYDEGAVGELLARGRLHSIGAFAEAGQLIGHMGITLRAHGDITADAGMTLVDPAFRGRGIARRVALGLAQQSMKLGLVGVHDYPVTVHAATQRIGAGFGVDTGLMLANLPGDVMFRAMETPAAGARTSSLMRWLPFGTAPARHVYLPERYRDRMQALYAAAHLTRAVMQSNVPRGAQASQISSRYDARRQILRLAVWRVGRDLTAKVRAESQIAESRGGLVAHVDLPLSDPATPQVAESLRAYGFFFAGLLPEYRDGDALRMQWLANSVAISPSRALATDSMRAIEAFVLEDRLGSATIPL
jgi:GNAT superfamily N-acetyltransferase